MKKIRRETASPYAVASDFCHLFAEEMDSLYVLALLLTAEQKLAEECFASALKDCRKADTVFKQWAGTWARRAIIQNAIRLIKPSREGADSLLSRSAGSTSLMLNDARLISVTALPAFERFVFVISVLESYSDQECRVLLGCLRQEVVEARTRALQGIGRSADSVAPLKTRVAAASATRSQTLEFIPPKKFEPDVEIRRVRSTQG